MGRIRAVIAVCGLMMSFALVICSLFSNNIALAGNAAKTVSLPAKKVKVGYCFRMKTKGSNVSYSSSDPTIACVSRDGYVFGKKSGAVTIKAKTNKGVSTCKVVVSAKKRLPSKLPVAIGDVMQTDVKMKQTGDNEFSFSMRIQNKARKGKIRKIVYYYSISAKELDTASGNSGKVVSGSAVEESPAYNIRSKTVALTARNIAAGKKSKTVSCIGNCEGKISGMKLSKIELYSGQACQIYKSLGNKYYIEWGTKDKKAPQFSGLIKKKSGINGDCYRIYYSDKKDTYNFKQFVTAVDDRDGKVKIQADTSKINWKKSGTYKIYFKAADKAGNVSKSWAKVQVFVPGAAEKIADQILASIIRKNWSDEKKARAMYRYASLNCSYISMIRKGHEHWRKTAISAIRYHSGDCYSYFSMSKLLLTRAGIPNIQVRRYPAPKGLRHYWNLAYVSGGWYHFDTTPRSLPGNFCLVTDAQLKSYSTGYEFKFNAANYPSRTKRKISPNPLKAKRKYAR